MGDEGMVWLRGNGRRGGNGTVGRDQERDWSGRVKLGFGGYREARYL